MESFIFPFFLYIDKKGCCFPFLLWLLLTRNLMMLTWFSFPSEWGFDFAWKTRGIFCLFLKFHDFTRIYLTVDFGIDFFEIKDEYIQPIQVFLYVREHFLNHSTIYYFLFIENWSAGGQGKGRLSFYVFCAVRYLFKTKYNSLKIKIFI